jgi:hypothetical protein
MEQGFKGDRVTYDDASVLGQDLQVVAQVCVREHLNDHVHTFPTSRVHDLLHVVGISMGKK